MGLRSKSSEPEKVFGLVARVLGYQKSIVTIKHWKQFSRGQIQIN